MLELLLIWSWDNFHDESIQLRTWYFLCCLVPRDHEDTANLFIKFINPKNLSKKASYAFRSNGDQKSHRPAAAFIMYVATLQFKCIIIIFKYFVTMHCCFAMRIKPTTAYENMWLYYVITIVNLLHVSVTFYDHLQGFFFRGIYHIDN
jgi:hypothetical protein